MTRRELPFLAVFGIVGLAFIQWLYFVAIHRLELGIALLIQYLAPLFVALWARFVFHRPVRRQALARACPRALRPVTRGADLARLRQRARRRGSRRLARRGRRLRGLHPDGRARRPDARRGLADGTYGFRLRRALLRRSIQPWWAFPTQYVSENVSLLGHLSDLHLPVWALMLWIIVLGAIVPFALFVGALHHIPATRASIVAMFEPVCASASPGSGWTRHSIRSRSSAERSCWAGSRSRRPRGRRMARGLMGNLAAVGDAPDQAGQCGRARVRSSATDRDRPC